MRLKGAITKAINTKFPKLWDVAQNIIRDTKTQTAMLPMFRPWVLLSQEKSEEK